MEIIRKKHKRTKEELKDLLVELLEKNGIGTQIIWNDFEFEGKAYNTSIQGEVFDYELHIEISGWFEKKAATKLRDLWKELVVKGQV